MAKKRTDRPRDQLFLPDDREEFWSRVLEDETAPTTTNFDQLEEAGVELPEPAALDDERLHATLWNVIAGLADLGVFVSHTDHLSDRALYTHFWHHVLREEVPLLSENDETIWYVDILGGWSEEDVHVWLTFYADDDDRRAWHEQFPEDALPPRERRPFDRDRRMPKPYDEPAVH